MKHILFVFITFSRLWKSEFRDLVNKVVEFLTQHNPDALDLEFVYTRLVGAQAELSQLQVPRGSHPTTIEISESRTKRTKLIRALVAQVRVLNSANTVYTIPNLGEVSAFVDRYLVPIVQTNSSKQNDILAEMFSTLDNDASLTNDIARLNLKSYFDELRAIQLTFNQKLMERSSSNAVRQNLVTTDVRVNAENALNNVLKEIELMQLKHSELDYSPLVNSLNDTFASYMSQVKARSTRRKTDASSKVNTINTTTTAQNGNSGTVAS